MQISGRRPARAHNIIIQHQPHTPENLRATQQHYYTISTNRTRTQNAERGRTGDSRNGDGTAEKLSNAGGARSVRCERATNTDRLQAQRLHDYAADAVAGKCSALARSRARPKLAVDAVRPASPNRLFVPTIDELNTQHCVHESGFPLRCREPHTSRKTLSQSVVASTSTSERASSSSSSTVALLNFRQSSPRARTRHIKCVTYRYTL